MCPIEWFSLLSGLDVIQQSKHSINVSCQGSVERILVKG